MLEVENLVKIFKKKDQKTKEVREVGIKGLNFIAKPGRIFGLIGANGAGKTTTMRILADLTSGQSGQVKLDGKTYGEIYDIKQKLGFVSGETQIYDRLTAYETMRLFAQLSGVAENEIKKRIENLVNKLNMEDFVNTVASGFSTGMKQKVSIARALVTDPEVLIFDEVTNGLDIFASRAVKDLIKELRNENRIVLYSTHIMPDADELCDDIAIIHKGAILDQGEVKALLSKHSVKNIEELFFKLVTKVDAEVTN